jgi:RND superfamily putative drug exporter
MSSDTGKIKGIAARAGHWSATHRKLAIWGWLAFVVVALFTGSQIGQKTLTDSDYYAGESARAERTLDHAGLTPPASEMVLVQSKEAKAGDPEFRAAVAEVTRRVDRVPVVKNVKSPYSPGGSVSKDRHSALVEFDIRGEAEKAEDKVAPVMAQVEAAQRAHPALRIEEFGEGSARNAISGVFEEDLQKAETLSLPITLVILLIAFGSLVAAGIPLLLAFSAVLATFGLVALPSQVFPVDDAAASVVLLIGMAVGVDYSLFYMRREREERAAGHDPRTALQRAAETSGRAVLVSGLTVMVAMAGMFFSGDKGFVGIGLGAMLVVGVAMVGSLTVLPAMLAWLGDRVERGRVPLVRRRRSARRESRIWGGVVNAVLRRPLVSAVAATAVLVALAYPALGMQTKVSGISDFPQDLAVMKTYDRINDEFPGENVPAVVVIKGDDVRNGKVTAAVAALKREAVATGEMFDPIKTTYSKDGTVAKLEIPMVGDGANDQSKAALSALRNDVIPGTVGKVSGTSADVSGMTAQNADSNEQMKSAMPIVFAFVLVMAFGLLLVTFRSIVIPIKAILLNLLSVGAAYGVLVYVFQKGHFENLLGFESNGGVTSWLPLFLFVVLFGLSMDYHVFILSRVREAVDRGMRTEDAVAYGIKSTAGVVTSAAFVMVAVFSIFATLSVIDLKQMGVGLAVAIAIDATIVRAVLLPATMKLLGEWNWYLPKSLGWLPKVRGEEVAEPAAA